MKKKTQALLPPQVKELRTQPIEPAATMVDGIPLPDDYESLNKSYELHSWVYAAAWAIAANFAQMEWKAYREDAEHQWTEYPQHDWVKLLQRPNPYMAGYQLREMLALSLDLSGNSYWIIEKAPSGKSKYIWPIPSHMMQAVSSKTKVIDYYLYNVNAEKIRFEFNEVVHLKYVNPNDMVYGHGSLAAVKNAVMADIYAQAYNRYFFKNSGRPDAVLETEQTLPEDTRRRVIEAWKLWNNGAQNRGKTVILEGNLKLHEVNRTMKDMDFVNLRKYSREEILGAFGVPPIMVGILESANMANSEQQVKLFWQHSIMPRARSIQDQLTMRIQQITFDPLTVFESDPGGVEAMQPNYAIMAEVATKFTALGIPLNQVIDKLDLPFDPVDGGDEPRGMLAPPPDPNLMDPNKPAGMGPDAPRMPPKDPPKKTNREMAEVHWKRFDQNTLWREENMRGDLRAFFRGQRRRVLKALDEKAGQLLNGLVEKSVSDPTVNVHLIFDVQKEQLRMRKVTDKHVSDTYLDFATQTAKRYSGGGISFDLYDPRVLAILEAKELKLVREVTKTTMERLSQRVVDGIQEAVAEGMKQGDSIQQIGESINELYDLAQEGRAETIARTEILGAANQGTMEGLRAVGIEKKEWLPPQPGKEARDWHQDMRDVVIPINERFMTGLGNTMDAPHDPDAPAEEVVNCRCQVIGVRE